MFKDYNYRRLTFLKYQAVMSLLCLSLA